MSRRLECAWMKTFESCKIHQLSEQRVLNWMKTFESCKVHQLSEQRVLEWKPLNPVKYIHQLSEQLWRKLRWAELLDQRNYSCIYTDLFSFETTICFRSTYACFPQFTNMANVRQTNLPFSVDKTESKPININKQTLVSYHITLSRYYPWIWYFLLKPSSST
jgi:hypothetical protein